MSDGVRQIKQAQRLSWEADDQNLLDRGKVFRGVDWGAVGVSRGPCSFGWTMRKAGRLRAEVHKKVWRAMRSQANVQSRGCCRGPNGGAVNTNSDGQLIRRQPVTAVSARLYQEQW